MCLRCIIEYIIFLCVIYFYKMANIYIYIQRKYIYYREKNKVVSSHELLNIAHFTWMFLLYGHLCFQNHINGEGGGSVFPSFLGKHGFILLYPPFFNKDWHTWHIFVEMYSERWAISISQYHWHTIALPGVIFNSSKTLPNIYI